MENTKEHTQTLTTGKTIFFSVTEPIWDRPYSMKRSDVYEKYKTVILRGKITDVKGEEFKVKLIDNNGFQRDGEEYVFHKGVLLSNQNFNDFASLGKYKFHQ